MDVSTPTVSPLRQRMLEDMRMRKFDYWLRVFESMELVCKSRRCWILGRRAESARIRSFRRSKCRAPSNGNGSRRV